MMGELLHWPSREPGRPYRWLVQLDSDRPASTCVKHREPTNRLGVCYDCVSDWRAELGAEDPDAFIECAGCGFPLHPAAEGPNVDTCPSCDSVGLADSLGGPIARLA
jgi:hypothetical protein